MTCRGVVPFIHTGSIRDVPGTAHRPFPTVSLESLTSAPIVPAMQNAVPRLIHRLRRSPFPKGEGLGVPPLCHPDRNEMEWRDLLKLQILPYAGYFCNLGGFLHSACAAVGMTCRDVAPIIHTGYICSGASPSPGLHGGAPGSSSGSSQKGLQGPGFEKWQALSREDRNRVLSGDSEWYPTTTSTSTSTSATTSTSN